MELPLGVAWKFPHLKGRNCRVITVFNAQERFGADNLTWYNYLNEMMDLRSFSNLWFWIALAVMWSSASHRVLGVPYDMVVRAARKQGQAEIDLHDMVRINVNRILYIVEAAGIWLLSFICFGLTSLAILGWGYEAEIAQALFLLGFPMTLVSGLSLRTALRIQQEALAGEALRKAISRLRIYIQMIGMASIFVTSVWGIYTNLVRHLNSDYYKAEGATSLLNALF